VFPDVIRLIEALVSRDQPVGVIVFFVLPINAVDDPAPAPRTHRNKTMGLRNVEENLEGEALQVSSATGWRALREGSRYVHG